MDDKPLNPLAVMSLVAGVLALVGHCGCCIPIVSYVAPFFVVVLEVTGFVLGMVARSQAEEPDPIATAGIATSVVAAVLSLAMVALMVGVILLYGVGAVAVLASQ